MPGQHFSSGLPSTVFHDAAAHTAHSRAIGQEQHFGADLPRGGAVPCNDRRQHCRLAVLCGLLHRRQKRRSKALGLRAGVFHFHNLRQNGQRDLFGCFGPDGKSDGGLHSFHPCSIRPGFQQLSPYQCGPAPAAHHANVSRRFLQDLLQAGHIKGMGAGHNHKVGLCPAEHLLQCLCKR